MAAHIVLPALDPAPSTPATFSRPILHDLLRTEMGFGGLVYTDSMSMDAVAKMVAARRRRGPRAAGRRRSGAALARSDCRVQRHQGGARRADGSSQAQIDASVERVLRAKASVGLHTQRAIDLDAVPALVGGRAHEAVAQEAFARAITLVKDDRGQVPLTVARDAPILYLSILDYPSGWQIAAPSRTFIPELKKRWPQRHLDRSVGSHADVGARSGARRRAALRRRRRVGVRAVDVGQRPAGSRPRAGAAAEGSGAHHRARPASPFVTTFFGNPYTASFVPELPAMLLTYDFYDSAGARRRPRDRRRSGDRRQAADHAVAAVQGRPRARSERDRGSGLGSWRTQGSVA